MESFIVKARRNEKAHCRHSYFLCAHRQGRFAVVGDEHRERQDPTHCIFSRFAIRVCWQRDIGAVVEPQTGIYFNFTRGVNRIRMLKPRWGRPMGCCVTSYTSSGATPRHQVDRVKWLRTRQKSVRVIKIVMLYVYFEMCVKNSIIPKSSRYV